MPADNCVAVLAGATRPGPGAVKYVQVVAGLAAIVSFVLLQNLFGGPLNAFFLRFPGIDKVLHVLEYLLIFVVAHALAGSVVRDRATRGWLAAAFAMTLGLADEYVQGLSPGRTVEGLDLIANVSGLILGWVLICRPRRVVALAAVTLAVLAATYVTWSTHVLLGDYSRALQYERQHDFVRAREHYRRAFEAGLRSPGLFNEMAWVEIESGIGDPSRAVEYGRTALEMQPGSADILDTYGWALLHAGRPDEALLALQQAYERKPQMYCIHYHLGATYLALGRRDDAKRHFRQQLVLAETREAAFARRALAEMERR